MNCSNCPSYNRGKGTRACIKCPDQLKIQVTYKPGPNITNLPADIVEDIAETIPTTVRNILTIMDTTSATMLIQSIILKMTHKEIAEYHTFNATKTVQRKILQAIEIIRENIK